MPASVFLMSALPIYAQVTVQINPSDVANAAPPSTGIGQVVGWVVGAAVVFGILAALIYIVLGAFQWITSGGDKGKVESARGHIVAAIVGLVIIVLSLAVMNFILQIIGIGSIDKGFTVPTLIKR